MNRGLKPARKRAAGVSWRKGDCECSEAPRDGGNRGRTSQVSFPAPAVVSLYPYTRQKDNELSFSEGTIICVTRRYSDGWCEGISSEGSGFFPGNYVEPSS